MGRICGFVTKEKRSPDLSALFAGTDPVRKASGKPFSSCVYKNMAIATDLDGQFAQRFSGKYACVLDGVIFNKDELDQALKKQGIDKQSASAVEAVLDLYLEKGVAVFDEIKGQFAIAILDGEQRQVVLARDAFGVKNLFYSASGKEMVFSSTLVGLARAPSFSKEIGLSGFLEYFACGYISAPWTIYEAGKALHAGECAVYVNGGVQSHRFFNLEPDGWEFADTSSMTENDLVDKLEDLIARAITRRLPAEGSEVSAYLSGGLDTSLVCAMLKERTNKNIVTYTLGFKDRYYDETPHANSVAKNLGLEHRPHYFTEDEFLETLSALPDTYGQPFADISAIPTCVIAKRASQDFSTIFTGEGPDFLFGNFDLRVLYYYYKLVPQFMKKGFSKFSQFMTEKVLKGWTSPNLNVPELLRQRHLLWVFTRMFKSTDLEKLTGEHVYEESIWTHRFIEGRKDIPPAERLRLAQYLCYGISDVLYKSSCAHSVNGMELMCPYYDSDVYNFIQYLPTKYKFRRLYGKYLHKQLLYRKIPRKVIEKPKRGFVMDFVEFGTEPIQKLTHKYLTRKRLSETNLIDPDFALKCVRDYYEGDSNMGPKMWTLLMFELWRDRFCR